MALHFKVKILNVDTKRGYIESFGRAGAAKAAVERINLEKEVCRMSAIYLGDERHPDYNKRRKES
jgi:hypothetical protein